MNKRRELLVAFGASALVMPLPSFAQQPMKTWRVGFLSFGSRDSHYIGGFSQGMRELGYVEGKNLVIEWRFAESQNTRLPGLAAELVQLKVDAIVTASPVATKATQKATGTIPIVMGTDPDPIGNGFVKSLARPEGNITGISSLIAQIIPKHLEMLRSIAPKLSRVAMLLNPANATHSSMLQNVQITAQQVGVTIVSGQARSAEELANAFAEMVRQKAEALIVAGDGLFNNKQRAIAELATKYRLPSVSPRREYVEAGGLMNYGPDLTEQYRRAATYVDKILKGAKPADLPVEQPTKFELVINAKTAKALGLKIPQSLLISADKVIE